MLGTIVASAPSLSSSVSDVFTVAGSALEFITGHAYLLLFAFGVPLVSIGFKAIKKAKG